MRVLLLESATDAIEATTPIGAMGWADAVGAVDVVGVADAVGEVDGVVTASALRCLDPEAWPLT
jgi:hypothetical protein